MTQANEPSPGKAQLVSEYARHTTGSDTFYQHWTKRFTYTEGVRFVADTCGAHWLIDLIASWQMRPKVRREPYQVWVIKPKDVHGSWIVEAWPDAPSNDKTKRLAAQIIEYSDWPEGLAGFCLTLEDQTLMLPQER